MLRNVLVAAAAAAGVAHAVCTPTQYGPFAATARDGNTGDMGLQISFGVDTVVSTTVCIRATYSGTGVQNTGVVLVGTGTQMVGGEIVGLVTGDQVDTWVPSGKSSQQPSTAFTITGQSGMTAGTTRTLEFTRSTGFPIAGWNSIIYAYSPDRDGSLPLGGAGSPHASMGGACINTVTGQFATNNNGVCPTGGGTTGVATTGTTTGGGAVPVGPGGLPNAEVSPSEFQHLKQLGGATFYWTVSGGVMDCALFQDSTEGWMGFGYQASMTDSDVTMGYVDMGVVYMGDYQVTGTGSPPMLDAQQNILASGGIQNGTRLTLRWRRNLNTGDPADYAIPAGGATDQYPVIVAYHPTSDDPTAPHTAQDRFNSITVPWFAPAGTCSSTCAPLGVCDNSGSVPVCNCNQPNAQIDVNGDCGCRTGFRPEGGQCVASLLSLTRVDFLPGEAVANNIKFGWEIIGTTVTFGLRVPNAGWMAVGLGATMANADCYQAGGPAGEVIDTASTGLFQPQMDASQDVLDYIVGRVNGDFVAIWERHLDTGDRVADKIVNNGEDDVTDIILASSPTSNFGNKHDVTANIRVNFRKLVQVTDEESGDASTPAPATSLAIAATAALLAVGLNFA